MRIYVKKSIQRAEEAKELLGSGSFYRQHYRLMKQDQCQVIESEEMSALLGLNEEEEAAEE
jgi:hypothetical protein